MTTPGAGEGERWQVGEQDDDRMYPVYYMAEGDTYSELAVCWTRRTADLICSLHNAREADQQTIANLEAVVHAYKRAAENAEQTIARQEADLDRLSGLITTSMIGRKADALSKQVAQQAQGIRELRKALEEIANWPRIIAGTAGYFGVDGEGMALIARKALATIAATEEEKS